MTSSSALIASFGFTLSRMLYCYHLRFYLIFYHNAHQNIGYGWTLPNTLPMLSTFSSYVINSLIHLIQIIDFLRLCTFFLLDWINFFTTLTKYTFKICQFSVTVTIGAFCTFNPSFLKRFKAKYQIKYFVIDKWPRRKFNYFYTY